MDEEEATEESNLQFLVIQHEKYSINKFAS